MHNLRTTRALAVALAMAGALLGLAASPVSALPTPGVQPNPNPANTTDGYWMLEDNGNVYAFGAAPAHTALQAQSRAIAAAPTGGYWILGANGQVHARGGAAHHGNVNPNQLRAGEQVTTIAGRPQGDGYWVFTTLGRAFPFGGAGSHGDMGGTTLNGPVIASVATPSGGGYWMVGSDGGIFSFGDARFYGSMGGRPLNQPVVGIVPDPDGVGYWLVAADGGIFAFSAPFRGSIPQVLPAGQRLNQPVIGALTYGNGYLMVASDGGIFSFSDKPFLGSLGANPPARPIVGVAVLDRSGVVTEPAAPTLTDLVRTSAATIDAGGPWSYNLVVDAGTTTVSSVSVTFRRPDGSFTGQLPATATGGAYVVKGDLNSAFDNPGSVGFWRPETVTVAGPDGSRVYRADGTVQKSPAGLGGPATHGLDFEAVGFTVNPPPPPAD
jgi:hypothetical protein